MQYGYLKICEATYIVKCSWIFLVEPKPYKFYLDGKKKICSMEKLRCFLEEKN